MDSGNTDRESVKHLSLDIVEICTKEILAGRSWIYAVLEAARKWVLPYEKIEARQFQYLIHGEAFNWLLLAERLVLDLRNCIPLDEVTDLLFHGKLPESMTEVQFREVLGENKYRAHLNFYYGVTVEEALMFAVEEEVSKEGRVRGFYEHSNVEDEVMIRLYGKPQGQLIRRYFKDQNRRFRNRMNASEWTKFVYWLFRLRLTNSDQARLASDTNKGLRCLARITGKAI